MDSGKIIIIDHEPRMVALVREILRSAGYTVLAANTGERALGLIVQEEPDLILLDITLPGEIDGREVIRRVRDFSEIPIVILTANAAEEDALLAFDLGVDEYITRPFSAKMVLARLRAVLKRSRPAVQDTLPAEIACKNLTINLLQRQVLLEGSEIHLTEKEYDLLVELARHRDRVVLHEQLLTAVWGEQYRHEVDYLRSYIHVLRRKLETNQTSPAIINKSGIGYMLVS